MEFSQFTWSLYKESERGQSAIASFCPELGEDCYDVAIKYNPHTARINRLLYADFSDAAFIWHSDNEKSTTLSDTKVAFERILDLGIMEEGEYVIKPKDYELALAAISPLSFGLSAADDHFFQNLFQYNFYLLKKIADTFELTLPDYPKKSDYRARCMYYWELCELFYDFRTKHGLSLPELSAFLYDFAPNLIGIKPSTRKSKVTNVWFIGGAIPDEDKRPDFVNSWQANAETKRGDILIHYETSPVSALTCIWTATTDGIIDPFFHWYSWVHMSDYTPIPPITLREMQADPYFAEHPLVRKKFQGVNGWQLTSRDYSELLRLIQSKGGDPASLPAIYVPPMPKVGEIKLERDVEVQLLEYYLKAMGYIEGRDYRRQLAIPAGRGHRIFPDYALHFDDTPDREQAKVLIEAKLELRNNTQIEAAFTQAYSYAKLLLSSVIVLCDRHCLLIYEKKDGFDRDQYSKYYWGELESPDVFNKVVNAFKK